MEDKLFNDFYESFYDERYRDVLIIDRQNYFFFNYTLCQDDCLIEILDNQSLIKCKCNIQHNYLIQNHVNIINESLLTFNNKAYDSFQKNNKLKPKIFRMYY